MSRVNVVLPSGTPDPEPKPVVKSTPRTKKEAADNG